MSIAKKDVEHIADLARLTFSEEEKEGLIKDLNNIILYVEKLNELNTDDEEIIVNPYYIENKFRMDEVQPSMDLKDVIKNAPDALEGYVVVPKVIASSDN